MRTLKCSPIDRPANIERRSRIRFRRRGRCRYALRLRTSDEHSAKNIKDEDEGRHDEPKQGDERESVLLIRRAPTAISASRHDDKSVGTGQIQFGQLGRQIGRLELAAGEGMYEVEVRHAAGLKLVGDEEAQIGEGSVDGELVRDGAAVRKAKLDARHRSNTLLQSCRRRGFSSLMKREQYHATNSIT